MRWCMWERDPWAINVEQSARLEQTGMRMITYDRCVVHL